MSSITLKDFAKLISCNQQISLMVNETGDYESESFHNVWEGEYSDFLIAENNSIYENYKVVCTEAENSLLKIYIQPK